MAVDIKLTPAEMLLAAQAGLMRHVENIKDNVKHKYGATAETDWQRHIEGALGEFAIAKYLNIFWTGKGSRHSSDVGEYDVRTALSHHYKLILHESDPDDRVVWLVTGCNGSYKIQGWILGRDGKQQKYWADPSKQNRPAFFIPSTDLNDPEELKKMHR